MKKNNTFTITFLLISFSLFSQISLEATIENNTSSFEASKMMVYQTDNETKYFDVNYEENTITIYNEEYESIKVVDIPLETDYSLYSFNSVGGDVYTKPSIRNTIIASKKLINDDENFEFCVASSGFDGENVLVQLLIFDEDGNILNTFSSDNVNLKYGRSFHFYHDEIAVQNKMILTLEDNSVRKFEIYSLPTSSTLSVDEINTLNRSLVGYPNPTSSTFNFTNPNNGEDELKLFDINGRLIKTKKINKGIKEVTFDSQDLSSGTYIYTIGNYKGKFIKK